MQVKIAIEGEVLHVEVLVVKMNESDFWIEQILELLTIIINGAHKGFI